MTRGSDPLAHEDGLAHYRLAWLSLVGGGLGASLVLWSAGLGVTPGPLLGYILIVGLLFAVQEVYRHWRPEERLSLMAGALALMIAGALFAGIIANAGLRLRYPLFDPELAAIDRAFGIDTPGLVRGFVQWPIVSWVLGLAYSSIVPLSFAAAIWLGFRREAGRLWEFVAGFAVSIQIAAVFSVFLPALGNMVHAGLGGLAGQGLPTGSGVYHLHAIAAYRDGTTSLLDLRKLEGVVTFPSFHMVMAVIVAHAFRDRGAAGHLVAGWCALVAISTVPIGGHYVIDLAAGVVLWIGVMALARLPALRKPLSKAGRLAGAAPEAAS